MLFSTTSALSKLDSNRATISVAGLQGTLNYPLMRRPERKTESPRGLIRPDVIHVQRRRHSPAQYWLIDWPVFLIRSAWAWYWTFIGVVGAVLILMTLAIVILWLFRTRLGW